MVLFSSGSAAACCPGSSGGAVMAWASSLRSAWSNLAPGSSGNSLVNRPPITSSSGSSFLRSHHVPWGIKFVSDEGSDEGCVADWAADSDAHTAGAFSPGQDTAQEASFPFHAACSGLETTRLCRAVESVSAASEVIQTCAARATTVTGNPATKFLFGTADRRGTSTGPLCGMAWTL